MGKKKWSHANDLPNHRIQPVYMTLNNVVFTLLASTPGTKSTYSMHTKTNDTFRK